MNRIIQITRRHLVSVIATLANIMILAPTSVGAFTGPGDVPIAPGIGSIEEVFDFLKVIVQWLLVFGLLLAVAMIIWGGIKYITAGGNEETSESAKKTVTNAIIGIVIVILAFVIVRVISNALITQEV